MVTVTLTDEEYRMVSRALCSLPSPHGDGRCGCEGCLADRMAAASLATRLSLEYGHPDEMGGE